MRTSMVEFLARLMKSTISFAPQVSAKVGTQQSSIIHTFAVLVLPLSRFSLVMPEADPLNYGCKLLTLSAGPLTRDRANRARKFENASCVRPPWNSELVAPGAANRAMPEFCSVDSQLSARSPRSRSQGISKNNRPMRSAESPVGGEPGGTP